MLRLRLFGVASLERDGVVLTGRVAQRHRLALLALLALAPRGRLGRDKLIACLWPDSDAARGRNLLKVATYVIRSELGDAALLSAGDELRLDTAVVETDVIEFEAALAQSSHARARDLYAGPLLDGFFLTDSPEFEKWLDGERARLAAGYGKALEALAEAAGAAGDFASAVESWKQRAAHEPYDSRVALRLMLALEANDNRAGALQHAAIHQRMLQEEFGVASAPEVAALAERLRREPARPAAVVEPVASGAADEGPMPVADAALPTHDVDAPPAAPRTASAHRTRWLSAAAFLLVLAGAGAGAWAVWPDGVDQQQSIVVLPFVNYTADDDYEYFTDGLTEEIITRLAAVPGIKVISRTSAMHYKGSTRPLPEIARELNVDHILEGSVRSSDGRVRVSAQLIDAADDGHVWAENYEHRLNDSFRVQEEIAHEVAKALEVRLRPGVRRLLVRQGTNDAEAYQLHQRGRFLWNTRTREGHARAIEYFERAIERDSGYADAYAGLAHVYLTDYQLNISELPESTAYNRLMRASERALSLDDESADAHLSFAIALQWQRNWSAADREYRRAISLNPGHATARSWYSLLLRGMGRPDEAMREGRRAAELDPFGVVINHNYGWQCYNARDYECAIEQHLRTLEISQYPGSWRGLALTYAAKGMHAEALAAIEEAVRIAPHRPDFVADRAYILALAGRTADSRASLARAKAQPIEAFNIARAHAALGEPDSAFAWLERSNWRWPHRATRGDPGLDPLRSDPRFAQLSARIERDLGGR